MYVYNLSLHQAVELEPADGVAVKHVDFVFDEFVLELKNVVFVDFFERQLLGLGLLLQIVDKLRNWVYLVRKILALYK